MKTTKSPDIRWKQRLGSFAEAHSQLKNAISIARNRALSDLEKQGLIQAFEFTHELSWNLLKDYFEYQGTIGISGSRDAAREAFNKGLVTNGEAWMEMIKSRNQTSHTYNRKIADEIVSKIIDSYFDQFTQLWDKMRQLSEKE